MRGGCQPTLFERHGSGSRRRGRGPRRRSRAVVSATVCRLLLVAASHGVAAAAAAADAAGWECGSDRERPVPTGSVIGSITIQAFDIFDTDTRSENRLLYRWANRLHRDTRRAVIRHHLLFHEGGPYSGRLLEESARLLRAESYLSEATVEPLSCHDGVVDVLVETHDTWTLDSGIHLGRSGGANRSRLVLSDANFLGTGKHLGLSFSSTVDRSGIEADYHDPYLLGSRAQLSASYAANDDGRRSELQIARPFYSLDARWAGRLRVLDDERVDHLYLGGEPIDRFGHREQLIEVSGGLSRGVHEGHAFRWRFGWTMQRDAFLALADGAGSSPEDRRLSYPWIGFERVPDSYLEARDLDQIRRTEDHQLGLRVAGRLGFSSPLYGGDRSRLLYGVEMQRAWQQGPKRLLELQAEGSGRYGSEIEDLLVGAEARYYRRNWGRHVLFARLRADFASNLDPERQLLLGGDSGLRGYPLRYQAGDRRLSFTLEQRVFTPWYPFHLAHVGAAAFLDVGRAWFADDAHGLDSAQRVLADVGVGLRLGLSKSGRGSMLHIDVAFPLRRDPTIESVQLLVATSNSF